MTGMRDDIRAVFDGVPAVTIEEAKRRAVRHRRKSWSIRIAAVLTTIVAVGAGLRLVDHPKTSYLHVSSRSRPSSASGDVPGKALPSGPGSAPAPVAGTFVDAVNNLGRSQYPGIYAGDYRNPDGSVTVYVSPGDDTSLIASLRSIDPTSVADASSGALPSIQVVRVPLSISALEEQAASVSKARTSLATEGYDLSSVMVNPQRGEVDVRFSSVPTGISVAAATSHIDSVVAPNVVVTSINAVNATT